MLPFYTIGTLLKPVTAEFGWSRSDVMLGLSLSNFVGVFLNIVVGMVVDGVSEVMTLPPADIRSVPPMGSVVTTEYLTGLASVGERMIILIDIEKLMNSPEMGLTEAVAA